MDNHVEHQIEHQIEVISKMKWKQGLHRGSGAEDLVLLIFFAPSKNLVSIPTPEDTSSGWWRISSSKVDGLAHKIGYDF